MGRGRQKAKHTKVARELKYFSPNTDLNALEREIGHPTDSSEPDYEDKWADLYPEDDAETEEDATGEADQDGASNGSDSDSSDAGDGSVDGGGDASASAD